MDANFQSHHPNLYLPTHMNLKSLHSIDIPPRKQLLTRRSPLSPSSPMMDSPKIEDVVFSKFLPSNTIDDDDDDPYSSDHFRMYEFKVRKCNRSRSHDWTDCPFAHPGEKARRRDPRRFHYSGAVCSDFRKGHCGKGDNCEFSHGVFECWLHPSRYRTEACKDGKNCKRKVCFFAHSAKQLRIPSEAEEKKNPNFKHCCPCCHSSVTASPTSTLMAAVSNGSPPASPPHISSLPYGASVSYKEVILAELMANFDAMNLNRESILPHQAVPAGPRNLSMPWVDVNFKCEEQQPQFVMSPSTPGRGHGKLLGGEGEVGGRNRMEDSAMVGPDLGWVKDLLT